MSAEFTEREKFDYRRAYRDAAKKVGGFDARLAAELDDAEREDREPVPVEQYTEIPANLIIKALDQFTEPEGDLGKICRDLRRACKRHGARKVNVLSSQLKMILDAAGLGEQPDAAKPGAPDAQVPR